MTIWGKIIGSAAGFAFGGPIGALLGGAARHALDKFKVKQKLPEELALKFAVPLTFIAIVVQDLKKLDHVIVMITCGLSSLLFFDAPFKSYIIISPIIALFVAALVLRLKK